MRDNYHKYTEEEKKWIMDHLHGYDSYKECLDDFNTHFKCEMKLELFRELCTKRLHIYLGKNAGKFTNSSKPRDLPLGTIRSNVIRGVKVTYIKVSNEATKISGYSRPNWIPYQEYVYENHFGKIPEGCMVIFLDCNHDNFSIENLACIDRKISVRLAQNNWYSSDKEITKTGILQVQLTQILTEGDSI